MACSNQCKCLPVRTMAFCTAMLKIYFVHLWALTSLFICKMFHSEYLPNSWLNLINYQNNIYYQNVVFYVVMVKHLVYLHNFGRCIFLKFEKGTFGEISLFAFASFDINSLPSKVRGKKPVTPLWLTRLHILFWSVCKLKKWKQQFVVTYSNCFC